jgi:hypothetical protein
MCLCYLLCVQHREPAQRRVSVTETITDHSTSHATANTSMATPSSQQQSHATSVRPSAKQQSSAVPELSLPTRVPWKPDVDETNEQTAFYIDALEMPAAVANNVSLVRCDVCDRSFVPERLDRHRQVCTRKPRKRKVFDEVKMRTKGTEFASYVGHAQKESSKPAPPNVRGS